MMYNSNNSKICRSYHRLMEVLTIEQTGSLYAFEIFTLLFNLLLNVVALCSIVKTRQYYKTYTRSIMYLCTSYILVSVITQPYMVYHFYYNSSQTHHCSKNIQTAIAILYFPTVSLFCVFLIVYDCHVNVTQHDLYVEKFSLKRTLINFTYLLTTGFIQDLTVGVAEAINIPIIFTKLILPVDIVLYLVFSGMHMKTLMQMKRLKNSRECLNDQNTDQFYISHKWKLTLTSIYLISVMAFKTPRHILEIIDLATYNKGTPSNAIGVSVMFSLVLSNCCGFFNAGAFIVLNEQACHFCKKHLKRLKKMLIPYRDNKVEANVCIGMKENTVITDGQVH